MLGVLGTSRSGPDAAALDDDRTDTPTPAWKAQGKHAQQARRPSASRNTRRRRGPRDRLVRRASVGAQRSSG
ncbi:hypothetical protein NUW54_g5482 [Trametes sanguinea]|uniref:Uncharacterized protein n=1 Tax=Trametes sanguinea TaxID=158606 RepID=A0ACC1PW03_9APHY|nr:hypothetical protein NUW54_g5482 [Trametes sanguinea]